MRRLGVGKNGNGERPLRAQLVVALVAGLILIAVPLYLWRRPGGAFETRNDAGAAASASAVPVEAGSLLVAAVEAGVPKERVKLAPIQKVKCSASPAAGGQTGTLCDALPPLEEALARAIRENIDCAPRGDKAGSINFVLTVDFASRKLHVFPGASGSWKGPQARRAAQCVKRALPAPSWNNMRHQYRYYQIAILATYAAAPSSSVPNFD